MGEDVRRKINSPSFVSLCTSAPCMVLVAHVLFSTIDLMHI